jgi:hypothetical protein
LRLRDTYRTCRGRRVAQAQPPTPLSGLAINNSGIATSSAAKHYDPGHLPKRSTEFALLSSSTSRIAVVGVKNGEPYRWNTVVRIFPAPQPLNLHRYLARYQVYAQWHGERCAEGITACVDERVRTRELLDSDSRWSIKMSDVSASARVAEKCRTRVARQC